MTDVNYTPEFDPVDVDGDYGSTGGDITVPTFHDIKPFRFWCQKALPLVYDDSLSYYEVLCKVVNYLNNMMTDLTTGTGAITQFAQQFVINQQFLNNMAEKLGENTEELEDYINDRMGDFTDAYNELQDYVNQYFNNLDVQDEIDTKLDEMAESGQFNVLFDPVIQAWMQDETEYINTSIATQNSTLAQQNARISTLEGRMDTFASLPSGSTSGNAELLDIRTNFLGETFGSAGDAVRTSDLVASGYTPLAITSYLYEGQPSGVGWFDVTKYKGGRIAFIANIAYNSIIWSQYNGLLLKVSDTNTSEYDGHTLTPDSESEYYYENFIDELYEKQLAVYRHQEGAEMYDSSRVLCIFKLKENFPYKYLGVNFSNESDISAPLVPIIRPDLISYGTYWLETPIDPTLSVSGDAADAKATGDALSQLNERLRDPQELIDAEFPSELLNMLEVEDGKYVDRTDGEIKPYVHYSVSGYIPVVGDAHYRGINIGNYAWYDSTKTFISGGNPLNDKVSPSNAKFLRVDYTTANADNVHVYIGKLTQTASDLEFKVNYPWLVHPIIDRGKLEDAIFLNLYDKNNSTDGYYLNNDSGDIGVASSYSVSNYIRIKPNTSYTASRELRYAFYDANKNYISGNNVSTSLATFTSPNNAQYLALSINKFLKDTFVLCESEYFNAVNVDHYDVILPWLRATKLSKFDGNTLVCFGDSITHMGYTDEINKLSGMDAINVGLSSGRYAYTSDSVKDKFSFYRIAYSISTDDWTIPNSLEGETGYKSVYANIQKIQTIDFSKVQFATIAYGTNDFSSGTELDNPSNPLDTNTFKGAIRYSLKLITEKYPHIKIMGVTPCYRFWSENGVIIDDCDTHVLYGHKLIDYVNAVKEVYTEYHLPVLDNLNNAGINQYNRLTYFGINDGLHPNLTGRSLLADRICDNLLANY